MKLLRILFQLFICLGPQLVVAHVFHRSTTTQLFVRGGGVTVTKQKQKHAFYLLANALQSSLQSESIAQETISVESIMSAMVLLSKSQMALKGLDGASHELYQRSHSLDTNSNTEVKGRATRSVGRIGCCADSLFGCELLDLLHSFYVSKEEDESTLDVMNREVVLNVTLTNTSVPLEVLVLYESEYSGGGGTHHGGIDGLLSSAGKVKERGRYLIVVKDAYELNLTRTVQELDVLPEFINLETGLVNEVACIHGTLWRCAKSLLELLEPIVMNTTKDNDEKPVFHFVGQSLAGGIVTLAAAMLDGSIPMPPPRNSRRKRHRTRTKDSKTELKRQKPRTHKSERKSETNRNKMKDDTASETTSSKVLGQSLNGFGKDRTSAVVLGAPPCLSSNVNALYITSVIYGDDVICRTTKTSLDILRKRISSLLNKTNPLVKQVNILKDTMRLTMTGVQSHLHGSEGEESKLSLVGNVYLVRPRRMSGGVSSMHEIGFAKNGREALRASVLWSLKDVLLSKSLWTHHLFESYIHGLDKVQLRKFRINNDEEYEEYA